MQVQVQAALRSQAELQQTQVHAQVEAALQSQLNILLQQFKESGQIPMWCITTQKPDDDDFFIFIFYFFYVDVHFTLATQVP